MILCRRWRRMVQLLSLYCLADKCFLSFRKSKTTRTITTLINGFKIRQQQNYISRQQQQLQQHKQLCSIKYCLPINHHHHQQHHNPSIQSLYSFHLSKEYYYYDNVKNRCHFYKLKNLFSTALLSLSSSFLSTTTTTENIDNKLVVNSLSDIVQRQEISYDNDRYKSDSDNDIDNNNNNSSSSEIWLIVGDGDLSYSSWLAQSLVVSSQIHQQQQEQHQQQQQQQQQQQRYCKDLILQKTNKKNDTITKHIAIIASVLEDEHTHRTIYKDSKINHDTIVSMNNNMFIDNNNNCTSTNINTSNEKKQQFLQNDTNIQYEFYVRYNIDATKLEYIFTNNNGTSTDTETDTSNLSGSYTNNKNKLFRFNRIIFNFPHIVGKNNIRYNRLLLHDFFKSACTVLLKSSDNGNTSNSGQIEITLFSKQSGYECICDREWKNSWQIPIIVSEYGLILKEIQSFIPYYKLSSYRGVDKSFITTTNTKRYTFTWPSEYNTVLPTTSTATSSSSSSIVDYATDSTSSTNQYSTGTNDNNYILDEQYQLAVRQEIRIVLDPIILQNLTNTILNFTSTTLIYGSIIPTIIKNGIPSGYRCVIAPNRSILYINGLPTSHSNNNNINSNTKNHNLLEYNFKKDDNNDSNNNNNKDNIYPILVFAVAYVGVTQPMTIHIGNKIRTIVENTIQQQLYGIHISKKNYPVSHPFPIRIYNTLIQKVEEQMKLQQNTIIITPHEQQQQVTNIVTIK